MVAGAMHSRVVKTSAVDFEPSFAWCKGGSSLLLLLLR